MVRSEMERECRKRTKTYSNLKEKVISGDNEKTQGEEHGSQKNTQLISQGTKDQFHP